jgi:anti-sigma regulatory factor (Ser/Thr protein kinase)
MRDDAIALTNDLSELTRLAETLQAFAAARGLSEGTLFAVNLALEELVTNTIWYGFPDAGTHVIHISLRLDGRDLHVRVEDDGTAFNPLERAAPDLDAPIEDRPIGGLGVHLVRGLMDDVQYERSGARNILSMRKRVTDGSALA